MPIAYAAVPALGGVTDQDACRSSEAAAPA
jgi:hypothetical protein